MSRKPNSECQIMVFRPTMEEFSDFSRYIQYMESQGAHRGGVAKIIPPKEWSPCKSYDNIDNLEIPAPISQVVTGQKGLYTQYNIQQKPMTVKEMRRLTNTDRYASPFHESYEDLERTYWKNLTFNPAIYGADISGSLYDKDVDVWNIARLDTILDMVENDTGVKIEGVNTAYLYFGMWKTSFAWHTEDMDLYSINYVHFGAPKTWYSIPPEHGKRLERLASGFFPNSNSTCPAFLRHKMTLISPMVLKQYGIPFNKITQEAGEFMITFPYGYHSGFNHGFNCAESTNFASERWIDYGVASEKCRCRKDMVYINMDLFVKTFQPEKYQRWKERKLEVKLSYTDIPSVPDFSTKPIHWRTRVEEIRRLSSTPKKVVHTPKVKTPHKTPSPSKAKQPTSPSPRKDSVKRPLGLSKMPLVKIEKTDWLPTYESSSQSPSPTKKPATKRTLSTGSAESLISSSTPSTSGCLLASPQKTAYQIKMGSVLPMSAVSDRLQATTPEQLAPQHFPTLMDRIKMSRRKLPSEGSIPLSSSGQIIHSSTDTMPFPPKTDYIVQLPTNTDHTMYTKSPPGSKSKSTAHPQPNFPPLPVKMQIMNTSGSPFAHLRAVPPETFDLVAQNVNLETMQAENAAAVNAMGDIKVTKSEETTSSSQISSSTVLKMEVEPPHLSSNLPTSSSSELVEISKPQGNSTKALLLASTSRPPIKRRHPVSKKGPSKKSSPAVVLKSTSADSESSDDEAARKTHSDVKRSRGRPSTKSEPYVETEGYPTLWPRRKVSFKAEKQYNNTVAKLPPHCAICTLFHPYFQRSFTTDEKPPPLPDVLKSTTAPKPGTKTKPLISEIIFATTIDNPAPLATCELLDEEGKSELIQCKVCRVQVHASCYGISRIENPWTCDRCSFKAWIAQCCLCCMRGGALKPVNDGLQWAHILCAVSIPEVSFDDIPRRNGINLKKLRKVRHKLRCTYCRRNKSRESNFIGTCIQCCAGSCAISFHPTCAHAAGVKMEPGDWPLPVFVYCHRHALQKERAMENKSEKALPEVTLEQRVYGKHKNGRYYPCVIRAEKSQTFHHVIFTDKSWSDNLYAEDIISHNFEMSTPKRGDMVTVKWTDGKSYEGEYLKAKKHQVLDVEFEDGSTLSLKREDVYTDMDDMPKRIRRKLSNATLMSDPDYLESPKKPTDSLSYASKKAAFHRKRKENREAATLQQTTQEIPPVEPISSTSKDMQANNSQV